MLRIARISLRAHTSLTPRPSAVLLVTNTLPPISICSLHSIQIGLMVCSTDLCDHALALCLFSAPALHTNHDWLYARLWLVLKGAMIVSRACCPRTRAIGVPV